MNQNQQCGKCPFEGVDASQLKALRKLSAQKVEDDKTIRNLGILLFIIPEVFVMGLATLMGYLLGWAWGISFFVVTTFVIWALSLKEAIDASDETEEGGEL